MKSHIYTITLLCLLLPGLLFAQNPPLQVQSIEGKLYKAEPQKALTISLRVSNESDTTRELEGKLILPEGWRSISAEFPFVLDAHQSDIRLISFFIPQSTLAGQYRIMYRVTDKKHPAIIEEELIYISIAAVVKLEVNLISISEYVIAGEKYEAVFSVTNASNIAEEILCEVKSSENFQIEPKIPLLNLKPGESRILRLHVQTKESISKALTDSLIVQVKTKSAEARAKAQAQVSIFPKTSGSLERFQRLPSRAAIRAKYEDDELKFQGELSGEGNLNEEGTQGVEYLLRGPNIQDRSALGQRDQYYLHHWTKYSDLFVGDRIYSLSKLTQNARYGRGFQGEIQTNPFDLGAYYQKSLWLEPKERSMATYINYRPYEGQEIGLNYIKKKLMI